MLWEYPIPWFMAMESSLFAIPYLLVDQTLTIHFEPRKSPETLIVKTLKSISAHKQLLGEGGDLPNGVF